jgi:hypothetical protein
MDTMSRSRIGPGPGRCHSGCTRASGGPGLRYRNRDAPHRAALQPMTVKTDRNDARARVMRASPSERQHAKQSPSRRSENVRPWRSTLVGSRPEYYGVRPMLAGRHSDSQSPKALASDRFNARARRCRLTQARTQVSKPTIPLLSFAAPGCGSLRSFHRNDDCERGADDMACAAPACGPQCWLVPLFPMIGTRQPL